MAIALGSWNTSKVTSEPPPCPYPDDGGECMEECMEQMEEEEEEEDGPPNPDDPYNQSQCEITCQNCSEDGEEEEEEEEEEEDEEDAEYRKAEDDSEQEDGCDPTHKSLSQSTRRKQRKHHYTFDVDDNGLDINGFVLQTDKHEGKRQKFRVYLDSNENGRFDKNDQLIGRTGIRSKHSSKGVGNLLGDDEIGLLEIKFKRDKPNASMRVDPQLAEITDGLSQTLNLRSLDFNDADASQIVSVTPAPGAAWEQLH